MAAEPKSEADLIRALAEDLALEILASYTPEDFADADFTSLVLQLSLRVGFALMPLPVTVLGHGLMDAPPQRPAEEMIEH